MNNKEKLSLNPLNQVYVFNEALALVAQLMPKARGS